MNKELIKLYVRKFLHFPYRIFCSIKSYFSDRNYVYNGKLAIVAIVKDEGQYIEEWIKYHKCVGIDHIYIYNNDSTDQTEEIIRKYQNYVTLINFPGQGVQLKAYDDAIRKYKYENDYMAFIDADEFLYSMSEKDVKSQIIDIFKDYPNAAGITVNWRIFGSSGHKYKPINGGVLDNYLYCSDKNAKGNDCIKTIVNPRKVYKYIHCHYPMYLIGNYSVDENGNKVKFWYNKKDDESKIRINHYFTKSEEEWIIRRSRPKADFKDVSNLRTMQEFYDHDNNDIYDDGMLKFVSKL